MFISLLLKPRFQTNDDIAMIYAYSGTGMFDTSTAVTAFSTKIWGLLMEGLYKITPVGIEIYTITFFFLIFISNVFIHKLILETINFKSILFWLLLLPALVFITLNFYLELQFTMVSGLLCFTAVLILIKRTKFIETLIAFLMIFLASIIRLDLLPIVLAFVFIVSICITFIFPEIFLSRVQLAKRFGAIALIACSVYFIDNSIYTESERHFLDFNSYRSGIVDYKNHHTTPELLPESWNKEELYLFTNWFYSDETFYSKTIEYKNKNVNSTGGFLDNLYLRNFDRRLDYLKLRNPYFLCLLIVSIMTLFFIRNWQKHLFFLCLLVLIYLIFNYILTVYFKEPPFRVSFVLFVAWISFYFYTTLRQIEVYEWDNWRPKLSVILLLGSFILSMFKLSERNQELKKYNCSENYDSKVMYIHWSLYPFEYVNPFKVSSGLLENIKFVWLCSFSIHPAINKRFGDFRYNNLTSDIIGKDKTVSFIMPTDTNEWKGFNSNYIDFVAKKYHKQVFFELVQNTEHCFGFSEFKLIEKGKKIFSILK